MDDFVCPWCGEDLLEMFLSGGPSKTLDAVYEAHAPECEPWLREMGLLEPSDETSPPCDREMRE